jgi:IMP dehydrogenase/GMP reductase
VLPTEVDTRTRLTRDIELGIPLISAAMDTVTESALAIAMAQAGGLGVIHRNITVHEQAQEVRQGKTFEAGMVVNPVTIYPDETLADALRLMADNRISGIPVVERGSGRLVGIVTNRDVRFASDPNQPVSELMTREKLVTVRETVRRDEATKLLHQHRIEKLLVVDDAYRCIGLITVKDIEKAQKFPNAVKDEHGRLRAAAATGTGADGVERAEALFDAGTDESPGEVYLYQGRSYKSYRGMGSVGAMARGSADRYFQQEVSDSLKLVPEGNEGQVPYKGPAGNVLHQLAGGLRAAMGYTGAHDLPEFRDNAVFVKISGAALAESHVHDVSITRESPNYRGGN